MPRSKAPSSISSSPRWWRPFDGRVQQTRVNPGANVTEQQDVLTEVIQLDPIQVIFNVTRTEAFEVQKLQAQDIAYPVEDMVVELFLPDGSLYEQKGKIDFVGAEIDPTTDTVLARGSLPNTHSAKGVLNLLPGQYVPVQVTVGVIPKALVVPEAAVVETQEGDFVYVIGDDNKIERRKVEFGRSYDHLRVVTSGLKAGEKLVMEGIQKVKAGVTVALQAADQKQPVILDRSGSIAIDAASLPAGMAGAGPRCLRRPAWAAGGDGRPRRPYQPGWKATLSSIAISRLSCATASAVGRWRRRGAFSATMA